MEPPHDDARTAGSGSGSDTAAGGTLVQVARAVKREVFSDHILMVASGLAFHAMLAVLPTLAAIAALWKLIADPALLEQALNTSGGLLPPAALELAREFITSVPEGFGLGLGLLLNLIFVLWTAQRSASGFVIAELHHLMGHDPGFLHLLSRAVRRTKSHNRPVQAEWARRLYR